MRRASARAVTRPTTIVITSVPRIISRESANSWSAELAGSSPWTIRAAATFIRSRLRSANQPRSAVSSMTRENPVRIFRRIVQSLMVCSRLPTMLSS
jgi:hypothetical protein